MASLRQRPQPGGDTKNLYHPAPPRLLDSAHPCATLHNPAQIAGELEHNPHPGVPVALVNPDRGVAPRSATFYCRTSAIGISGYGLCGGICPPQASKWRQLNICCATWPWKARTARCPSKANVRLTVDECPEREAALLILGWLHAEAPCASFSP